MVLTAELAAMTADAGAPPPWLCAVIAHWARWPTPVGVAKPARGAPADVQEIARSAAARAAYQQYAERLRGRTFDDPGALPSGWRAAHAASWTPLRQSGLGGLRLKGEQKGIENALVVVRDDGSLLAVAETTPTPTSPDQAFSLLRLVLRREGAASGPVPSLLLPRALHAYARVLGAEAASAATEFRDNSRPLDGVAVQVARCEHRRRTAEAWRFLRLLDPEIVSVLTLIQAADILDYNTYQAAATRLHRLQAARAYPLLAPVIMRTPALLAVIDEGRPLSPALAAHYSVPEKTVRRLSGVSWRDLPGLTNPEVPDAAALENLVRDLRLFEPGQLPRRRRDWVPFLALRAAASWHSVNVGHRPSDQWSLLHQAAPKWSDMAARMLAAGCGDRAPSCGDVHSIATLARLTVDANDVVRAVYRNIVLPISALVAAERQRQPLASVRTKLEKAPPAAALALASEMAYGALTPHKILKRSRDCHERPDLFQAFGTDLSWEPLFPPCTAPNGVVITPLTNSAALTAEGRAMRHCVGGYGNACDTGGRHILSLRSAAGERLSTAEVERPRHKSDFALRQHRGVANREPPVAAESALEWVQEEILEGRLELDVEHLETALKRREDRQQRLASHGGTDPLAVFQAFAMWRPYLEKPWSKMDVQALLDEVARRTMAWT